MSRLAATSAHILLLDVSVDRPLMALRRLTRFDGLRVIAFGVLDLEQEIIGCAEAGIAGYVTRDSSVAELLQTIRDAVRGEFSCPPHIASRLLRRLALLATDDVEAVWQPCLTLREQEILRLLDHSLSNKEIAKLLCIQVATVKNHVHNILAKLGVRRRADAAATIRFHQKLGTSVDPASARPRI